MKVLGNTLQKLSLQKLLSPLEFQTFNGNIQDVGEALGHYEYITINRGSGLLSVINYTKKRRR